MIVCLFSTIWKSEIEICQGARTIAGSHTTKSRMRVARLGFSQEKECRWNEIVQIPISGLTGLTIESIKKLYIYVLSSIAERLPSYPIFGRRLVQWSVKMWKAPSVKGFEIEIYALISINIMSHHSIRWPSEWWYRLSDPNGFQFFNQDSMRVKYVFAAVGIIVSVVGSAARITV